MTSASETPILIEVVREWAPRGADRFYQLVLDGFYKCSSFFRVVEDFVVQWGIAADPSITAKWEDTIPDDSFRMGTPSNGIGFISFAKTSEPDSRNYQVFVNLDNNAFLDDSGFVPFARVVTGLEVFAAMYNPTPDDSTGIAQSEIKDDGNVFVLSNYPDTDIIWEVELVEGYVRVETPPEEAPDLGIKGTCEPGPHAVSNLAPDPDPLAPDAFAVRILTSASDTPIVLEVFRGWAPFGADRFYQLVLDRFYVCSAFYRIVDDFVVQWGIAAEPSIAAKWDTNIPDDTSFVNVQSNDVGYVSYAKTSDPNSRTFQVFVNLDNNSFLDADNFVPFARVASGLEVFDLLYNPTPDDSGGISQAEIKSGGIEYVLTNYPETDIIWEMDIIDNYEFRR